MGKITHFVHQSLDGFIEGPNGEFDWPCMDGELSAYSQALTDSADIFLYGRVAWDMMSGFWPRAEEFSTHEHDLAFAPVWRKAPKVVVSSTLTEADWNTRVINTDVIEQLTALKESGAHLLLFGGSALAGFLTEHRLIDEYQIFVHPVVLGGGKPVFTTPQQRFDLTLAESRTFDSQVVLLRHERIN
ncbi:dihydrofolate reductase family protein [Streptomyces actinomycinicus]|uniref:Dihydrofolate reductase family protein n=1 Tax=Streptomyces actinomycinicus TaxID=1695166 RepID=A0A937JTB5_9ACTN|nr:dihydrofolate reductase family protein [Streptomyces actinomycinicus]MBL1087627.1 dihydrofolate reductase family protein [Streptomyces actinomycinicus]